MPRHNAIGRSLKQLRQARSLTQEDFYAASGRTYVSQIERGIKTPTLDKIDELSEVLALHPLTMLTVAYLGKPTKKNVKQLLQKIERELGTLLDD